MLEVLLQRRVSLLSGGKVVGVEVFRKMGNRGGERVAGRRGGCESEERATLRDSRRLREGRGIWRVVGEIA